MVASGSFLTFVSVMTDFFCDEEGFPFNSANVMQVRVIGSCILPYHFCGDLFIDFDYW